MIAAAMAKTKVTEQVVDKDSDVEKQLTNRLADSGFVLSYPVLETADGVLLTQVSAIA